MDGANGEVARGDRGGRARLSDAQASLAARGVAMSPWRGRSNRMFRMEPAAGPTEAGVVEALTGGGLHTGSELTCARALSSACPVLPAWARAARRCDRAAVREMIGCRGVRQLVVVGAGMSVRDLLEASQRCPGPTQVVTVDRDPVAHQVARRTFEQAGATGGASGSPVVRGRSVHADLVDCDSAWREVLATGLIDADQPIALMFTGVLHHVVDSRNAPPPVAYWRSRLPAGSLLYISHATTGELSGDGLAQWRRVQRLCAQSDIPVQPRSHQEIRAFFAGWSLVEPGLVGAEEWALATETRSAAAHKRADPSAFDDTGEDCAAGEAVGECAVPLLVGLARRTWGSP